MAMNGSRDRRRKPSSFATGKGNPRTSTIKAYVERQVAQTGLVPTVTETAKILAMSPDRVQQHYKILGFN